jgi:tRNA A-37 threonylcarbamoyl transferase component Bud32
LAASASVATSFHVQGPLNARRFSRIFRGDGDVFPCPVAIKVFVQGEFGDPPLEAAGRYHRALEEIYAASLGDPVLAVPRPFGLIEELDCGLVVAEWIEGPVLSDWLPQCSRAEAVLASRNAGIWLSRLQRSVGVTYRPMEVHAVLEHLRASIGTGRRGLDGAVVTRAAQLLDEVADRVATEEVGWCRSHGDFKPENLVSREGQIVGIDLDLREVAPAVHDIAHFLNHLQILCYPPWSFHRLGDAPSLVGAFCQGYATDGRVELPPPVLTWQRLGNALSLLLRHSEWSRPPRAWVAGLALRRLVKGLTRDLSRLASSADPSAARIANRVAEVGG